MSRSYYMRAKASDTGLVYNWHAVTPDFAGAGYVGAGGTGTPTNVLVESTYDDGAGGAVSVTGTAPRAKFVMTSNDALTGLGARDGYTPVDGDVGYFVGQTTSAQGGYWVMHAGAATRPTFYDSDPEVSALVGALVYVEYGTLGTGTSWQQTTGITLAGAKTFAQLVGNPDTVVGENNSRTELGHDEGTATGRLYSGSRYKKEIASTIAAGATATVWDFDGAALGLSASDVELLAPNVVLDWASDDKAFWGTASALVRHGTPPVVIRSKTQDALDSAGGSATAYATIAWDVSGNIVRLRVTNNRASACSCVVSVNYLAAQVR